MVERQGQRPAEIAECIHRHRLACAIGRQRVEQRILRRSAFHRHKHRRFHLCQRQCELNARAVCSHCCKAAGCAIHERWHDDAMRGRGRRVVAQIGASLRVAELYAERLCLRRGKANERRKRRHAIGIAHNDWRVRRARLFHETRFKRLGQHALFCDDSRAAFHDLPPRDMISAITALLRSFIVAWIVSTEIGALPTWASRSSAACFLLVKVSQSSGS